MEAGLTEMLRGFGGDLEGPTLKRDDGPCMQEKKEAWLGLAETLAQMRGRKQRGIEIVD